MKGIRFYMVYQSKYAVEKKVNGKVCAVYYDEIKDFDGVEHVKCATTTVKGNLDTFYLEKDVMFKPSFGKRIQEKAATKIDEQLLKLLV